MRAFPFTQTKTAQSRNAFTLCVCVCRCLGRHVHVWNRPTWAVDQWVMFGRGSSNIEPVEMSATGSNTILPRFSATPTGQCNKAATFKKTMPENIKQPRWPDLTCSCGHTRSLAVQKKWQYDGSLIIAVIRNLSTKERKKHFRPTVWASAVGFCSPVRPTEDTQKHHQEWRMFIWQW